MLSDPGPVHRGAAAKRRTKFEGLSLEPVAPVQTRSLRGRTVKIETQPCSGQLSAPNNSETAIDGTPGDNTRSLRGRTVKIETPPCSGQLSAPNNSETAIDGTPGDNIEEQAKLTAEGLPEDWIKEVKPKRNNLRSNDTFYVDPKTGYAFHSLEDAVRYIQTGTILNCLVIPQKRSREDVLNLMKSSETRSMTSQTKKTQTTTISSEVKLNCDGLPGDWIKEMKPRKKNSDRKDTFYIDPKTGYAFLSLKDALRYLETGDVLNCATKPRKRSIEEIRILSSQTVKTEIVVSPTQPSNLITDDEKSSELQCEVVQENQLTSNGLPTSWIKELKPRKDGSKMDPFYIDPDTRYAFSSIKDALRYLASGNIRSCVVRPRQRSIEELQALMTSCKMSSIFGMKTVQQESVQCVQPHTLYQKRKRSPMEPLDLKPEENLKAKATKTTTRSASRKVKQRTEEPLFVRASPRLLSLKAEHGADENHEENNDWCNTMPGMSNSSAPSDLDGILNSQPDTKSKEDAMAANGSSTRNLLPQEKTHKERSTSLKASFRLASQKLASDTTATENSDGMISDALLEPSPSLSNQNPRPSSQLKLEHVERTEWANGSPTKIRSRGGLVRKERRAPTRASPRLAAQKVTNDATSVENDNSMMSNAIFEPLPSSPHPILRPTSQPEAELNGKTIEGANSSSTISLHRVQIRGERPTSRRASSRLAAADADATSNGTSVENNNSAMSSDLLALSSPSKSNLRLSSQPEDALNDEGANSHSVTSLRRVQMQKEIRKLRRASSHFAAVNTTSDVTTVKNENCVVNHTSFKPSPSFSSVNAAASQPDLALKEEKVPAASGSLFEVSLRREKQHRGRPVALEASSQQASFKATFDSAGKKEDRNASNYVFEPPTSRPDLNLESTSSPAMDFEELTTAENGRGSRTIVQKEELLGERPATIKSSSHTSALWSSLGTTSDKNHGNDKRTYSAVTEVQFPTAHPDLNFGPTSQPYIEDKKDPVNGSAISTISRRAEPHKMLLTSVKASPSLDDLRVTTETTSCKINEKNNITTGAWSKQSHFPGRPDLNLGPTNQFSMEQRTENTNACATGSTIQRMNVHSARPTRVVSMSESPSCYNYGSNFKISNYFCEPVDSPANQIIMGSTNQPNPVEVRLGITNAAPPSVIAASKTAPDLNMVPMSWPEPIYGAACPLGANPGPRLQQQPAGVNTVGEFHLPQPVHSEMLYQDPTMDALLSGQEVGPSMQHMSIDALNSPGSPFYGDLWHDPCLSYAFKTLSGGADQRQRNPGLGPQNNVNWAGVRNGYPSQNPGTGGTDQRQLNPGLGPENNVNWAGARNSYPSQNPVPGFTDQRQKNLGLGPQNNVNWDGAWNSYPSQNPVPGVTDQRQQNPGLGSQNNVNWAGARNGYPSQNPGPGVADQRQQNPGLGSQNNVNRAGARNGFPIQNPGPGVTDQRQQNPGLGSQNNVNWAGARNGYPSQNPSPSASASRNLQNFNFGVPFPKR